MAPDFCHRISCGCGYEPLMAKNIDEYIQTIKKVVNDEFPLKPKVNMVTNGMLLGQRNLDSLEYLDWVHISVHSHRKENFERIEKGANFDTLVSNIKNLRKKYTDLNIEYILYKMKLYKGFWSDSKNENQLN